MNTRVLADKNGCTLLIEEHLPSLVSFTYSAKSLRRSMLAVSLDFAGKYLKFVLAFCTLVISFFKLVSAISPWKIFRFLVVAKECILVHLPILELVDQTNVWILWGFCLTSIIALLSRRYPGKFIEKGDLEVCLTSYQRSDSLLCKATEFKFSRPVRSTCLVGILDSLAKKMCSIFLFKKFSMVSEFAL